MNAPTVGPPVSPNRPFRVKAILFKVEAEFYDPTTGKTVDRGYSQDMTIFEADFFPGLVDFLKSKGVLPGGTDEPIPTSQVGPACG